MHSYSAAVMQGILSEAIQSRAPRGYQDTRGLRPVLREPRVRKLVPSQQRRGAMTAALPSLLTSTAWHSSHPEVYVLPGRRVVRPCLRGLHTAGEHQMSRYNHAITKLSMPARML